MCPMWYICWCNWILQVTVLRWLHKGWITLISIPFADISSHPCQSCLLHLICNWDHMLITVMDLTPHAVVVSAAVCPFWQKVTIISHNSVNTETWGRLWSQGLFTPELNHALSNVLIDKMCFSFGHGDKLNDSSLLHSTLSTITNASGCCFHVFIVNHLSCIKPTTDCLRQSQWYVYEFCWQSCWDNCETTFSVCFCTRCCNTYCKFIICVIISLQSAVRIQVF